MSENLASASSLLSPSRAYTTALRNLRCQVRARLVARDINQSELAAIAELHHTDISRIVNGKRVPTLATLSKLASAFQCPVSELLEPVQRAPEPAPDPTSPPNSAGREVRRAEPSDGVRGGALSKQGRQ